jgi:IS5 family transposase
MASTVNRDTQYYIAILCDMISPESPLCRLRQIFDLDAICNSVKLTTHHYGARGFGKYVLIKCMLIQFFYNLSDRLMAIHLQGNIDFRCFVGIDRYTKTPDHSTFARFRRTIGPEGMKNIFEEVKRQLKVKDKLHDTFYFLDATKVVVKKNTFDEVRTVKEFLKQSMDVIRSQLRAKIDKITYLSDEEKTEKYNELIEEIESSKTQTKNNKVALTLDGVYYESGAKYSFNDVLSIVKEVMGDDDYLDAKKKKKLKEILRLKKITKKSGTNLTNELVNILNSTDANFGAKSSKEFWFGYKKTVLVDMGSGLIIDVLITSASVPDSKAAESILPKSGAIVADKGYLELKQRAEENGLHTMIIQRNNMKTKNKDLDNFLTKLRAPYESVFSKKDNLTRYKGKENNQGIEYLFATAFDMARALKLII